MKGLVLNFSARVLVIAFQFVNIKLYTNSLDVKELGVFFFLIAVSYSANAILFVPMDYFQQARVISEMSKFGNVQSLLLLNRKLLLRYIVFSFLIVGITFILHPKFTIEVILVIGLALILYIVQALRNTLNNLGHGNQVSISFIQEAVIKVILFYFLIKYINPDVTILVSSWIISLIITGIYLVVIAKKQGIFSGGGEAGEEILGREVFDFAYPFSVGAVANWLQMQGYRLLLVPLGYSEVVGMFATLSGIGSNAIGAATLIYTQQFSPKIYQTKGECIHLYLKGALILVILVSLGSYILGEYVVEILTNSNFLQYWPLILFGVLIDSSNLFSGGIAILLSLTGDTKKAMLSSLLGLFVLLVLFAFIYFSKVITVYTVGIPLLMSQWCVVLYLYLKFVKRPSKMSLKN